MVALINSSRVTLYVLGIILVLGANLLWLGSEEQIQGSGIKCVYIHVDLFWTV